MGGFWIQGDGRDSARDGTRTETSGASNMSSRAYKTYLLAVLMSVLAFSYVDRDVFGVAQESIRVDLHLTDTQVGVLNGIGFALFFAVAGLPIARWVDRGNRVALIGLTTGIWSIAVSMCGWATGFGSLLACRMATATGESGCIPVANSLIAEEFERGERPRAVGLYMLGAPLGALIGYFSGGWLNQHYGWRHTFIIVGVPGLLLAAVAALSLREPRRQPSHAKELPTKENASLRDVATRLLVRPTLRNLWLCYLAWYFSGWGLQQWLPTFFIRAHGLSTESTGIGFALALGMGGLLGSWLGGDLSTRYAFQDEQRQLSGAAVVFALLSLLYGLTLLIPSANTAFAVLGVINIFECALYAPLFATMQTLVPARMRATALALSTLLPTFIGMGIGPSVTGVVSDLLRSSAGKESLRVALLILCPGYILAGWFAWRASRTVLKDVVATATLPGPASLVPS